MSQTSFDILILGGGPGGYVAALRAAQLGQSVAVVEARHLGCNAPGQEGRVLANIGYQIKNLLWPIWQNTLFCVFGH